MGLVSARAIVFIGVTRGHESADLAGLIAALPETPSLAFVVAASATQEGGALVAALATVARFPVIEVGPGSELLAGQIHVWTHAALPHVRDRQLVASTTGVGTTLDRLFGAVSTELRERAIAVLLPGSDMDGVSGLRSVQDAGGLAFACTSVDSHEPSLHPDLQELVASVSAVATVLQSVASRQEARTQMPPSEDEAPLSDEIREEMHALLRKQVGHDFSGYKPQTFSRRVSRRLLIEGHDDLDTYLGLLRTEPNTVIALGRDLLIGVTGFFRNPEAFAVLGETVLRELLEGRGADETVRLWVPGCATGEEVYSLGILVREQLEKQSTDPAVRIFATDIDQEALARARAGLYTEASMAGVSSDRRERYFARDGGRYRIRPEVREMCIFAPHNITSAPPLSRMDLISCRNLLIYFGSELQSQVFPTLHYALRPNGWLFLGSAESAGQHRDLFAPVDPAQRVFRRRTGPGPRTRLPMTIRTALPRLPENHPKSTGRSSIPQLAERQMLDRHAPAHVVVDEVGEVLHFSGNTGPFLEVPRGAPSSNIRLMARPPILSTLRTLLQDVQELDAPVSRTTSLGLEREGPPVLIHAEPLLPREDRSGVSCYLIVFELQSGGPRPSDSTRTEENASLAHALEAELQEARERLQFTIEEYETALEELKVSNEELASLNEEAHSSNEELEASREEMQSLNEELSTINAELSSKVAEAESANSDLRNLYESAGVATVFLAADLVIRDFTPEAATLLRLRDGDRGRPLSELSSVASYPELEEHIRAVATSGEELNHRVMTTAEGEHYLVRLVPYRDPRGARTGVVLTFVDVTAVRAEERLKTLVAELNHRVKNMLAVVIALARNSARPNQLVDEYVDDFCTRLKGLASSYELLARESWAPVQLRSLVETDLAPHGVERFSVEGEAAEVTAVAVIPLGMALHELATNAVKHGALSAPGGHVTVSWRTTAEGLELRWTERGGPEVRADTTADGFGIELLRGQVEYQLGGSLELGFERVGLEALLRLPGRWMTDE